VCSFFALAEPVALRKHAAVFDASTAILSTHAIRYGRDAWLVEFAEEAGDESFAIAAMIRQQLEKHPPPHLREFCFAYTRVLLEFAPEQCPSQAPEFFSAEQRLPVARKRIIEVCYDGEDLPRVARHCHLTVDEVIALHSSARYRVHFLGFAPGFPYLSGLPARLNTPRLDSPRTRIAAGSVGIGGAQTGIYPLPTAGGWNIIGRMHEPLFDPSAPLADCTLLRAGDELEFRAVTSFSR
jgi:inhibitor of KinA